MPAQTPLLGLRLPTLLALGLCSIPAQAKSTTLMFLVDWFLSQPMDTVINQRVYQPSEVSMVDGSTVPTPQQTTAFTSQKLASWWALPGFDPSLYTQGRLRLLNIYSRGWFQNDETYKMTSDTLLDLAMILVSDTQSTFTYRLPATAPAIGKDTTVFLASGSPRTVALPAGSIFYGPKLYTSSGNGGTALLNVRKHGSDGLDSIGSGDVEHCIDSLQSDTVWIRFAPAGQQNPASSGMRCYGTNPYRPAPTSISWTPVRRNRTFRLQESSGVIRFSPTPGSDLLGRSQR